MFSAFLGVSLVGVLDDLKHQSQLQPTDGHNAQGGYVEECGELPGLVGDDC